MSNAYKVSVGKSERETFLKRLWHRWEDHITGDLKELRCEDVTRLNCLRTGSRVFACEMVVKFWFRKRREI